MVKQMSNEFKSLLERQRSFLTFVLVHRGRLIWEYEEVGISQVLRVDGYDPLMERRMLNQIRYTYLKDYIEYINQ